MIFPGLSQEQSSGMPNLERTKSTLSAIFKTNWVQRAICAAYFLTCAPAVPYFNQNASTDMYNGLTFLTNYAMIKVVCCISPPHNADYVALSI